MSKEEKTNKEIIQSYLLTTAKYNSNKHTKRILTHIVNAHQELLNGHKISDCSVINIDEDLFREKEYTINLKNLLAENNDKNYAQVKKAFKTLQTKFITIDNKTDYVSVPFIMSLNIKKRSGVAKFKMSDLVVKAFTDFTKGYRKVEFNLTLSFNSVFSSRIYELICRQQKPLTRTIEQLKEMFELTDKYDRPTNFINKVIKVAHSELKEKSTWYFEYKINKKGRKYHSITFIPIYNEKKQPEELKTKERNQKESIIFKMSKDKIKYFKIKFNFDTKGIKNNLPLLEKAMASPYFTDWLDDIITTMENISRKTPIKSKPAFFISELKKRMKEVENKTNEKQQKEIDNQNQVKNITENLAKKFNVKT